MVACTLTLDKLYNYVDAECDREKNLMDVSADDLERLAAELNSDRLSNSSNRGSYANSPEGKPAKETPNDFGVKGKAGQSRKAEAPRREKVTCAAQTELSVDDINKWQRFGSSDDVAKPSPPETKPCS